MEVVNYFIAMERYALGDLELLHQLSRDAEQKEVRPYTTSSTTTYESTYPTGSYSAIPQVPICRATIPFTLMIFSCMDILGYLVRLEGRHTDTTANIIAFFEKMKIKPSADELSCLITLYRHGLAHNYFPKLGQSISYHSKNPDSLFLKSENDGQIILNVNKLESLFLEGFTAIKEGSTELYFSMEKRFQGLTNHYNERETCKLINP